MAEMQSLMDKAEGEEQKDGGDSAQKKDNAGAKKLRDYLRRDKNHIF